MSNNRSNKSKRSSNNDADDDLLFGEWSNPKKIKLNQWNPNDINTNNNSSRKNNNNNKNNSNSNYRYSLTVRKKEDRDKLRGFTCDDCKRYYETDKLSPRRLDVVLNRCSRHREISTPPPTTPPHFWELDFPDSDEKHMLTEEQPLPSHVRPMKSKRKLKLE